MRLHRPVRFGLFLVRRDGTLQFHRLHRSAVVQRAVASVLEQASLAGQFRVFLGCGGLDQAVGAGRTLGCVRRGPSEGGDLEADWVYPVVAGSEDASGTSDDGFAGGSWGSVGVFGVSQLVDWKLGEGHALLVVEEGVQQVSFFSFGGSFLDRGHHGDPTSGWKRLQLDEVRLIQNRIVWKTRFAFLGDEREIASGSVIVGLLGGFVFSLGFRSCFRIVRLVRVVTNHLDGVTDG